MLRKRCLKILKLFQSWKLGQYIDELKQKNKAPDSKVNSILIEWVLQRQMGANGNFSSTTISLAIALPRVRHCAYLLRTQSWQLLGFFLKQFSCTEIVSRISNTYPYRLMELYLMEELTSQQVPGSEAGMEWTGRRLTQVSQVGMRTIDCQRWGARSLRSGGGVRTLGVNPNTEETVIDAAP